MFENKVTTEMLVDMNECGHRTLTVAPEAGTERLRQIINKPISDRLISNVMESIGACGIPRLKLYLQVGLPFETDEDIEAIPPMLAMIKAFLARGSGKRSWPGR